MGEFFQVSKVDGADFAVFQRHCIAMVALRTDSVDTEQFSCHLEAGDLLLTARADLKGFEVAQTYRVQISERIVHPVQQAVFRHFAAAPDDLIQSMHIGLAQSHRQTELVHAACRTAGAQAIDVNGCDRYGQGRFAHVGSQIKSLY